MATAPLLVAALGDSLSAEYLFEGPIAGSSLPTPYGDPATFSTVGRNSAQNWPMILGAIRPAQVSFGDFTLASRGEPRYQGFSQDWAQGGVAATDANPYGDLTFRRELLGTATSPGLLTQSRTTTGTDPADVNVVTILLGTNDYFFGALAAYQSGGATNGFVPAAGSTLTPVNATIELTIAGTVASIRSVMPNTKIVLVTPLDLVGTPFLRPLMTANQARFPLLAAQMRASAQALTSDLTAFATVQGLGFVNFDQILQAVAQSPNIGGITVDLAASGAAPTDAYVGDGLHPGTMIQGLLGQAIVGAINQTYGATVIPPVSNIEIAAHARATTPTIAIGAASSDGVTATLGARVVNGPGATAAPTGIVNFERFVPASGRVPARLGEIIGQSVLGVDGQANLVIPAGALDGGPIVAVYSGDIAHTAQSSTLLTAAQVLVVSPTTMPITPVVAPTVVPAAAASLTPPTAASLAPAAPFPVIPTTTLAVVPSYNRTKRGGTTVTVTVTVIGMAATPVLNPSGTVTLRSGGHRLRFVAVERGQAVATFPLARLRGRVVSATYTGDGVLPPAQSTPVRVTSRPAVARGATRPTNASAKPTKRQP